MLITTSFSYQKALGHELGDDGGLTSVINQHRGYAPTDFDRTFDFTQSYVYQLPFGKERLDLEVRSRMCPKAVFRNLPRRMASV